MFSDSTKLKISETLIRKYASGEIIPTWLGKQRPETTRRKLSETHKKLYAEGKELPWWKGKRRPKSTGLKISKTRKRKYREGKLTTSEQFRNAGFGRIPWNKGLTKDTDERIRLYGEKGRGWGKKFSEERRAAHKTGWEREKILRLGEGNPNWRGGTSPERKLFEATEKYKLWRSNVFERDDYTCQNCKIRGGRLHAHHLSSYAEHPELRTEINNGITVCERCHHSRGFHTNRKLFNGGDSE